MIVFIAMIIVASVAAGVLINTSGSLQQQARATGEETISEVSSGIKVLAAKGKTTEPGDQMLPAGHIETIYLIVRPYAGTQGINLENTIIQYKSDYEVNHLTYEEGSLGWGREFNVHGIQDVSGTGETMLETMGDIVKIELKTSGGLALGPSESATITFYPNSGFKTTYGIQVPPTTESLAWYEL